MNCELSEKWVHKHVDRELPLKQVAELREHLAACGACAALSEELHSAKAWFVPAKAEPIPEGFAQRVAALAFAGEGREQTVTMLSHLPGGTQAASAAQSTPPQADHFMMRMTALAAGLLAILGLALYVQNGVHNRDLMADENNMDSVIDDLDRLNEEALKKESIKEEGARDSEALDPEKSK